MLIVMNAQATPADIERVCKKIEILGFRPHTMPGAQKTAIGITGNPGPVDPAEFEDLSGVAEAIRVSKPYKLVSREVKSEDSIVYIKGVPVGGEEGLKLLAEARDATGLGIVTEAIDVETFDLVEDYADCIQIGARNMQNFSLLRRAGRSRKPVLLKRGMSATLEEFLMAAEYVLSEGNYHVILCERGVRTFSDFSRNTLDLAVVPAVKKRSHLPILVDPSHGTGKRHKVLPLSLAAVAVGADGLLVEVHHEPENALSDGVQSILPEEFAQLSVEVRQIAGVLGRHVN